MIWRRASSGYAELPTGAPRCARRRPTRVLDGLFQQALLAHLAGEADAAVDLRAAVTAVVAQVVPLDREPVLG